MRKSGLHKQISSIFDGVPIPPHSGGSKETEPSSVLMQPQALEPGDPQTSPDPVSAVQPPQFLPVKRMSANPSQCASAPAIQLDRPMPLPKSSMMAKKTGPGISSQVKKMLFGAKKGSLDARQKKMAGLVGILGVVFGVVMFISLGGVGPSRAVGGPNAEQDTVMQGQGSKKTVQDWARPQPLPADLRDATSTVSINTDSADNVFADSGSGELVVMGIVFSQYKPSAIINNQIFTEGQTINGITIVRITKNTVEFKANNKQWTQQVQRSH